ncbi:MAG: hypothetical protein CMD68_02585 [Gammaproteobacteria bacterium]|nr:hypothetical protein [Gammaproteobacteria bacterium]|tara:strand:+ start:393 stop:1121 length:729 start_codon:yes stop_codon:yes gene_type:complete
MKTKLIEFEHDATKLLRSTSSGILSTISKAYKGYPFGSYVTYITGPDRSIYIYASTLAQHTKNLFQDSKACLTLSREKINDDKQNSQRLTLMGDLKPMNEDNKEYIKKRFHKFLPESKKYSRMHDFDFYKLSLLKIRWIGGFGEIAWLKNNNWKPVDPKWLSKERDMIDHMNEDHSNVIYSSLKAQHGKADKNAKMIALCIDGYFIKSKNEIFFISFEDICLNAKSYRDMLIKQAKQYRKFE